MMKNRILLFAAALALFCGSAQAQIGLPKIIGDNMVLQQGKEVAIWGTGVPGRRISVKFDGQNVRTTVGEDGKWMLHLAPMQASHEPGRMTISDGKTTIRLEGVLIGEVWLASGQSNMEYRMQRPAHYLPQEHGQDVQTELFNAGGDKRINVVYVDRKLDSGTLPGEGWKTSSKESIAMVSAPAYLFAKTIADSLDVPVGLISSTWGGTQIEVWMPKELIDEYTAAHPESKNATIPESAYGSRFTGMIEPMVPYTLRGFLWYQGESNLMDNPKSFTSYYDKQKLLVESWRELWGDSSLPFYYVQLAPYAYSQRKDIHPVSRDMLPQFWEIQQRLMDVPHTGMASTTDLVDKVGDIHPPYKHIVGYRLALWALRNEYGRDSLETLGPVFESAQVNEGKLEISFSHADGLNTSDGKPANWFQLIYSNGKSGSPEPVISGEKLIFSIPDGYSVGEIRFGWDETAMPNLMNGAGLPALPFRYSFAEAAGEDI